MNRYIFSPIFTFILLWCSSAQLLPFPLVTEQQQTQTASSELLACRAVDAQREGWHPFVHLFSIILPSIHESHREQLQPVFTELNETIGRLNKTIVKDTQNGTQHALFVQEFNGLSTRVEDVCKTRSVLTKKEMVWLRYQFISFNLWLDAYKSNYLKINKDSPVVDELLIETCALVDMMIKYVLLPSYTEFSLAHLRFDIDKQKYKIALGLAALTGAFFCYKQIRYPSKVQKARELLNSTVLELIKTQDTGVEHTIRQECAHELCKDDNTLEISYPKINNHKDPFVFKVIYDLLEFNPQPHSKGDDNCPQCLELLAGHYAVEQLKIKLACELIKVGNILKHQDNFESIPDPLTFKYLAKKCADLEIQQTEIGKKLLEMIPAIQKQYEESKKLFESWGIIKEKYTEARDCSFRLYLVHVQSVTLDYLCKSEKLVEELQNCRVTTFNAQFQDQSKKLINMVREFTELYKQLPVDFIKLTPQEEEIINKAFIGICTLCPENNQPPHQSDSLVVAFICCNRTSFLHENCYIQFTKSNARGLVCVNCSKLSPFYYAKEYRDVRNAYLARIAHERGEL